MRSRQKYLGYEQNCMMSKLTFKCLLNHKNFIAQHAVLGGFYMKTNSTVDKSYCWDTGYRFSRVPKLYVFTSFYLYRNLKVKN